MKYVPILPRLSFILALTLIMTGSLPAAPIPGLFNTGVGNTGLVLAQGSTDPHWRLIQSADAGFPGPTARVVNDTGFPIPPWLANGPNSKWIAPQALQSSGNQPGDYKYRLTFNLTGLEPATAVISGFWTSDNGGPDVLLNGVSLGLSGDGNFGVLGNPFTITTGFVDGTNTLDFVVNNGPGSVNPTGFRCEISGTADLPAVDTPPTVVTHPASVTVGLLDPVTFTVGASGTRPFTYLWRRNGTPIAGATNSSYTIPSAQGTHSGQYDVVVSNSFGFATSSPATLTVAFLSSAQLSYEPPGPSSRRTGLAFTEIMYHPAPNADGRRTEFIEIYNSNPFIEDISGWRLTGAFNYTFPSNTVLQGNRYLVVAPVPADVQAVYGITGVLGGSTNQLPNEGGTIRLVKRSGGVVLEVEYSDQPPWPVAADGTGQSLALARPSYGENNPRAWAASAVKGGSPGVPDPVPGGLLESVVINEVLAHTDPGLDDYLELFNAGTLAVDLSGCWLSDDPATNKFRIPDGVTLGERGFLAFDEVQLGFSLRSDGETIYLVNSNRTRVVDAVRFAGQANAVASGRYPDGTPGFQELRFRTPGTTNAVPWTREIVINELYYNPLSGDENDEFLELYNRGGTTVSLAGWRFTSGISFSFPANASIPAGGYVVVAKNAARLVATYPGLNSSIVYGDYGGALANGGERVALGQPDFSFSTEEDVTTTNVFYVTVDEVTYVDGGRWGRWSDGGGSSMELIDVHSDNRAGSNWGDSDETTKSTWTTVEHTGVLDLGSGTANKLQIMLLGPGEALIDDVEVLVGGFNRVTNSTIEVGTNGWIFGGTHNKTTLEPTGYNSSRSLHVRASARGDLTANRLSCNLSSAVAPGAVATLRAKVKWLRGHPEILLRLKGNYLEAFGRLTVPANVGTPGAPNSVARANAGPVITEVAHRPILPQTGQAIRVTAQVSDPDAVANVTLWYRIDGVAGQLSVPMTDDGSGSDALAGDGVYTASIPGQASGRLVAFRVEAADGFAPSATTQFPATAPAQECLVRVGDVQPAGAFTAYRLWLTAATVNTWSRREKLSNEDLDGTFVYGNTRAIYNVGAHYSGSPYTSPGYDSPVGSLCGYDISMPPDDLWLGSTHTIMDWPVRDDTNQREQLMFWFLEQYGLPNMYRRYVIMYVNGNRRGALMDDIQQPTGETIEEFFPDDSEGAVFKPDCWDEFDDLGNRETSCVDLNALELYTTTGGVKKTARYRWVWRPRATHGTENDYSPLFSLIDAANAPASGYLTGMESQADMEHWMRTFAMNDLASFWDAFGNPNAKNTHLYKPERDRWKLLCWDFDVGLGVFNDLPTDALFPTLNDTGMNRVYTTPAWLRFYWGALREAVDGFFQTGPGTKIDTLLDSKYAAFQANGISLASPNSVGPPPGIKLWISQRRTFLLSQLNTVAAPFNVTSSAAVTTTSNLVTITGTAPVTMYTLTVNGEAYVPTWISVTSWRLVVPVTAGVNVLQIAGLDRFGNPTTNTARTVTVTYTGADELAENNVVINEIMYNPAVPEASYVELFNRSLTYAFKLSGWRLNGVDFTFPDGATLAPGGFLVVCKDRAAFSQAYGWGIPTIGEFDGQLDDGGETLSLLRPGPAPGEMVLVDRVTYDDDAPWPASADGQGASLQLIAPAQDNNRVSNWLEAWSFFSFTANVGSSNMTRLSLFFETGGGDVFLDDISLVAGASPGIGPNLLVNGDFEVEALAPWQTGPLGAGSAVVEGVAHSGNHSLHLVLGSGAQSLTNFYQDFPVLTTNAAHTLSFWYLPGAGGNYLSVRGNPIFTNTLAPRFTPGARNRQGPSLPAYPALWINEVQPNNVATVADNVGDQDPWIELYNGGSSPISLSGFSLSSTYSQLAQWPFPASTVIQPGQFLLVWADAEPGETAGTNLHTNFRLNATGGSVALSRLVGGVSQILDYVNYGNIGPDRSFGSYPDGQVSFRQTFQTPTPRRANNPSTAQVTLFINEWMAANGGYVLDPADLDAEDWFEIYNPNATAVNLEGFTLTDNLENPDKFTVPAGISVPARGFLLVWADEEAEQTNPGGDLHVNFKLSQDGEAIALYDPAGQLVDSVTFANQTNNISQGRSPDGAPEPFAWLATPTPAQANTGVSNPTVLPPTFPGGGIVRITWTAQTGHRYQLQYKNGLGEATWKVVSGDVIATGATATKDDSPDGTQRFYRVVEVP